MTIHQSATGRFTKPSPQPSRRRAMAMGGAVVTGALFGTFAHTQASHADPGGRIHEDNLGPGVTSHPIMSGALDGGTLYLGSRNLNPPRVAAFEVSSRAVTNTYVLNTGNYVEGLAASADGTLYAGVTNAADEINLYKCDPSTGQVTDVAAVPGLFIRDLAVAPDGAIYITGEPRPPSGSHLYRFDPENGSLTDLGTPVEDADQGTRLAVTDTTLYYCCNSPRSANEGRGLYAIDRTSGELTYIRDNFSGLRIFDDIMIVGDPVALCDLRSGVWTDFEFDADAFARHGNAVIACDSDGLLSSIDLKTLTVKAIGTANAPTSWGILDIVESIAVGAMDSGSVWMYDLGTGESEIYELMEAGAEGDAEMPLSGATGDGYAYVAGNRSVSVHELETGSITNFGLPGEAKDMISVGDTTYMGVYNGHGLWAHRIGEPARQVADLPASQNRPEVLRWDSTNGLLAMGVQADSTESGSLCIFDPINETMTAHIDPFGANHAVRALATGHGLVYIGGSTGPRLAGDIAAWDPVAGEEVWRLNAPLDGDGISSLVVYGNRLFGTTLRGPRLFVIELSGKPRISDVVDISHVSAENPALVLDRAVIYGAAAHRPERAGSLFRIYPRHPMSPELIVDNLDGDWFGRQNIDIDDDHHIYTLRGRDLIRVRDHSPFGGRD